MVTPFNNVQLSTNGIATNVCASCASGRHITRILPNMVKNIKDSRRLSRYELNCQLICGIKSIGSGGSHAETVMAHLGLPFSSKLRTDGFARVQEDVGEVERLVAKGTM